jgi:hypothetical protein
VDTPHVRQCWTSIAVAYISYIPYTVSPTTHNPFWTPDTMSSSIQPTLPISSSDPTEASIQRFGPNPFDPVMIVEPKLRLNEPRNQMQHKIRRGSCKPSSEDDLKEFRKVYESLTRSKREELWDDLRNQRGPAESQTIRDELTRYCDESGLSIIACFTLPDYIRLVEKRPDWVTVYGAERESFARHLSDLSIAPEEPCIQGDHDPPPSRYEDFEERGRYTASDPGQCGSDHSDRGTEMSKTSKEGGEVETRS